MMKEDTNIRLGIVGCGYVTRMSHLPAAQLTNNVQVVALIDLQLDKAKNLAQTFQVPFTATDYHELFDKVDAVIVAVPHQHHCSTVLDFLAEGIHVLVEKPMAINVSECQEMITAAERSNVKLAVGHMRRFYDSNRLVKRLIETCFLGEVQRFEAEEAVLFETFNASPFTVLPPSGGVLLDTGSHILDLLLWWLGDLEDIKYWDDSVNGIEANCRIETITSTGVPGSIELSRTRHFLNKINLYCDEGIIEVFTLNPSYVFVHSSKFLERVYFGKFVDDKKAGSLIPYFAHQLSNFARSILEDIPLEVPGVEGMRSISIIERCKSIKQPMEILPWMQLNESITQRFSP